MKLNDERDRWASNYVVKTTRRSDSIIVTWLCRSIKCTKDYKKFNISIIIQKKKYIYIYVSLKLRHSVSSKRSKVLLTLRYNIDFCLMAKISASWSRRDHWQWESNRLFPKAFKAFLSPENETGEKPRDNYAKSKSDVSGEINRSEDWLRERDVDVNTARAILWAIPADFQCAVNVEDPLDWNRSPITQVRLRKRVFTPIKISDKRYRATQKLYASITRNKGNK